MKPKRPNWYLWFMRLAYVTAERGTCNRKQVGALVVRERDQRIVAAGYNGAPRHMPDCFEAGCDVRVIDGRESCVRTLHAESNALDLCGPLVGEPHTMITTVIPCRLCALRIIQSGIRRVVYHEFYQSQGTLEVAELFERKDKATLERIERNGGGGSITPRVELLRLDVDMRDVKPTYGDACTHAQRICDHPDHQ